MIRAGLLAVTGLVALLSGASPASAHPMPHSVVTLDVHGSSVTASLQIPATADFVLASGVDPGSTERVRDYLAAHLHPAALDGRPWRVALGAVRLGAAEQTGTGPYRELLATATLTPPPGGDVRHFRLGYDAVIHQVITHTVLVSVREDWAAGKVGESAAGQVGVIAVDTRTMTVPDLTVDLGGGSAWRGFLAMFRLGGRHIAEGTDHLLFLLVLLLPVALRTHRKRWRGYVGAGRAARRIGAVTCAFTVGHSIALAASALGRVSLPAWPVEAFIAASILIGALHAVRPLFPEREALVACLFGLGHGLAFSFTLAEMGLSTGQLAISLLGFNLGIEVVQLLLVGLALPVLIVAARLPVQPVLRLTGAGVAAVASAGWLADRLGRPNPVAATADRIGGHTVLLVTGLVLVAVLSGAWALLVVRRQPATSSAA
ncbi:HupE/UreJ family protein [Actinoplanes sp. L3-i22]|uniref:HupE/UreJ family protein n=1 Tax=Actinoplanes sp. L3-i22 TaxID=2836373 RepID=UPI001C73F012|nr:HupE/UreJ family protein [Actinoplanes sp. L3-i22]BCY12418.1 membrane protein [Actinoplanes sp. L3-i22]